MALGGLFGGPDFSDALAELQFTPGNVQGMLGSATFTGENNDVNIQANPVLQGLFGQMGQATQQQLAEFNQFDTQGAAQNRFDQIQSLIAGDRDRQRASMESKLFARGQFGSTAGGNQINAFNDAVAQERTRNAMAAMDFAQQQRRGLLQGALQSAGGLLNVGQAPNNLANLGLQIGQGNFQAGQARAGLLAEQARNQSDFGSTLMNAGLQAGMAYMTGGGSLMAQGAGGLFGGLGGGGAGGIGGTFGGLNPNNPMAAAL